VELRSPDGSADIHSLISAIVLGALHGMELENGTEMADRLYVSDDIHKNPDKYGHLNQLPDSCYSSAAALEEKRAFFERDDVFPSGMIDNVIARLRSYGDEDLSERLEGNVEEIRKLVLKYIHVQ
jgi:glutamine synthetase